MNHRKQIFTEANMLMEGTIIKAIDRNIEATDCEVIDATVMIIMPGFVDTHQHVWESLLKGCAGNYSLMEYLQQVLGNIALAFNAQDVYTANLLSSLEALDAGIATLRNWSHFINTPENADHAMAGLQASGTREKT